MTITIILKPTARQRHTAALAGEENELSGFQASPTHAVLMVVTNATYGLKLQALDAKRNRVCHHEQHSAFKNCSE